MFYVWKCIYTINLHAKRTSNVEKFFTEFSTNYKFMRIWTLLLWNYYDSSQLSKKSQCKQLPQPLPCDLPHLYPFLPPFRSISLFLICCDTIFKCVGFALLKGPSCFPQSQQVPSLKCFAFFTPPWL